MTVENTAVQAGKAAFTEINLTDLQRKKLPKRLVYFSDGVLEEYSTDEEELDGGDAQPLIDPKTLSWMPYFGYLVWWLGSRTLAVCDYLGENLAWLLGITTPKFQYELDQYEKMAKEEEELNKYIASENAGWASECLDSSEIPVKSQPKAFSDEIKQNREYDVESTTKQELATAAIEVASKF